MIAINGLLQLLIYLLLGGLVVYVVYWIIGMLTLPEVPKRIICVIVALIVLLWILNTLGIFVI